MAKKKTQKKKEKRKSLELSLKGLFGLGVVSFCIFIWMFLLGVWVGQTLLLPESGDDIPYLTRASNVLKEKMQEVRRKAVEVKEAAVHEKSWNKSLENSIFSIQIASTDSREKAVNLVLDWQAKGYDAFFRAPEDGFSYRIFVGGFKEFTQAQALADTMEKSESVRAYITILPVQGSHDS